MTPLYSRPKSDPLAWRREGEVVALFDPDTLEVTTSVFYSQRDTTQDRGRLLTASERIRAARVMERS